MKINPQDLLDDGFVVLREVIPPAELEALRTAFETLVDRQRELWAAERGPDDPPGGAWEIGGQPRLVHFEQLIDGETAAAVEFWKPHLAGSVVAIGTAPTALYRLLELIGEGADKPALVLGFPVGFIGAVESKQALSEHAAGVPFITLHGRLGGSALAAAAVNALAGERS